MAHETEQKIDVELKELRQTLANIEEARPFEQLTASSLYSFQLSYSETRFRRRMLLRLIPVFLRLSRPW